MYISTIFILKMDEKTITINNNGDKDALSMVFYSLITNVSSNSVLETVKKASITSLSTMGHIYPVRVISALLDAFERCGSGQNFSIKEYIYPNRVNILKAIDSLMKDGHVSLMSDEISHRPLIGRLISLMILEITRCSDIIHEVQGPCSSILTALSKSEKNVDRVIDNLTTKLEQSPHYYIIYTVGSVASTNPNGIVPYLTNILPIFDVMANSTIDIGNKRIDKKDYVKDMDAAHDVLFFNWLTAGSLSRDLKMRYSILEAISSMYPLLSDDRVEKGSISILTFFISTSHSKYRSLSKPTSTKNQNEVFRCYDVLATSPNYNGKLIDMLLIRLNAKEESSCIKAMLILKHLLNSNINKLLDRLDDIISALYLKLHDPSIQIRKVLAQLTVLLGNSGYLRNEIGKEFIQFIVHQTAINGEETELVDMCDSILKLLVNGQSNSLLWPYLLDYLFIPEYLNSVPSLIRALSLVVELKLKNEASNLKIEYDKLAHIDGSYTLFSRLIVLSAFPFDKSGGFASLELTKNLVPLIHSKLPAIWDKKVPLLQHYAEAINSKKDCIVWDQTQWENWLLGLLEDSVTEIDHDDWTTPLIEAFLHQLSFFYNQSEAFGQVSMSHPDLALNKLENLVKNILPKSRSGGILNYFLRGESRIKLLQLGGIQTDKSNFVVDKFIVPAIKSNDYSIKLEGIRALSSLASSPDIVELQQSTVLLNASICCIKDKDFPDRRVALKCAFCMLQISKELPDNYKKELLDAYIIIITMKFDMEQSTLDELFTRLEDYLKRENDLARDLGSSLLYSAVNTYLDNVTFRIGAPSTFAPGPYMIGSLVPRCFDLSSFTRKNSISSLDVVLKILCLYEGRKLPNKEECFLKTSLVHDAKQCGSDIISVLSSKISYDHMFPFCHSIIEGVLDKIEPSAQGTSCVLLGLNGGKGKGNYNTRGVIEALLTVRRQDDEMLSMIWKQLPVFDSVLTTTVIDYLIDAINVDEMVKENINPLTEVKVNNVDILALAAINSLAQMFKVSATENFARKLFCRNTCASYTCIRIHCGSAITLFLSCKNHNVIDSIISTCQNMTDIDPDLSFNDMSFITFLSQFTSVLVEDFAHQISKLITMFEPFLNHKDLGKSLTAVIFYSTLLSENGIETVPLAEKLMLRLTSNKEDKNDNPIKIVIMKGFSNYKCPDSLVLKLIGILLDLIDHDDPPVVFYALNTVRDVINNCKILVPLHVLSTLGLKVRPFFDSGGIRLGEAAIRLFGSIVDFYHKEGNEDYKNFIKVLSTHEDFKDILPIFASNCLSYFSSPHPQLRQNAVLLLLPLAEHSARLAELADPICKSLDKLLNDKDDDVRITASHHLGSICLNIFKNQELEKRLYTDHIGRQEDI
ncbi:unnamed protein product [Lepeophtheirus salmonis]|uniref:(salmon louse) hypothetical protein n=1 Tax=Lepeophtheirus salmonis TaxID=72036 RepID=A0A7R8CX19_LEPSM|nr:unnamed protein product [Lepeophtheirus salmonis]CAF2957707.1 unnamed protein product [Lepeophtheirus salmonis]